MNSVNLHRRTMDDGVADTMEDHVSCSSSSGGGGSSSGNTPTLVCLWRRGRTGVVTPAPSVRTVIVLMASLSLVFTPHQVLGK